MQKQQKASKQKHERTKKKKPGRPKESVDDKVDFALVEKYASLGLTDVEIGFLCGVTERTINRWKKDRQFLSALKKGKLKADANVIQSLYKRANGFEYEEVTREQGIVGYDEQSKPIHGMVTTKIVKKQVSPETLAINTWLNNRRRQDWSRNPKSDGNYGKPKVLIIEDE
jgi:hypothetical protein